MPLMALGGEPEAPLWQQHLQECQDCHREWQELAEPLQGLQELTLDHPQPPAQLVEKTMARVRAASRPLPWWRRWAHSLDQGLQNFAWHRPTLRSGLVTAVVALCLLGKVLSPHLFRGRSQGSEVACQRNLRLLRSALEHYAQEHGGLYPDRLPQLMPEYLKEIPLCPENGHEEYRVKDDHHAYQLRCSDPAHQ